MPRLILKKATVRSIAKGKKLHDFYGKVSVFQECFFPKRRRIRANVELSVDKFDHAGLSLNRRNLSSFLVF